MVSPIMGQIILLRGLARRAEHWGSFPSELSATLGRPVSVLELPGMGADTRQKVPLSIQTQAQQLLLQLQAQAGSPWHLVGMSLGGMVALEIAKQAPKHVASVALINSSVAGLNPFYQRLQWHRYPQVLAVFLAGQAQREALILRLTSRQSAPHPMLATWRAFARQAPLSRRQVLRQLWAASRYRFGDAPVCAGLVLSGAQDQLVSPECSKQLAAATGWPIKVHPSAGHDLALDAPEWLAQQLNSFYQSLS